MRNNILTCLLILGCLGVTIGLFRDRAAPTTLPPTIPIFAHGGETIEPASAMPFPEQFILSWQLPTLQLSEKPKLEEALGAVADAVHCQLLVKGDVLQQVGVQRATPIQLYEPLGKGPVEDALNRILSAATDSGGLAFIVKDHVIIVSTWDDLSDEVVTLAYDVRDLIQAYMQAPSSSPVSYDLAADAIMNFVTAPVAADTWRDNGGDIGRRGEFMGILFVTQTRKNQSAIAENIAAFHQAVRAKLPLPLPPRSDDQQRPE